MRRRAARYVHRTLAAGLSEAYVDVALIGRRSHPNEARSWAAVTRGVLTCAKLDSKEGQGAVERMAEDTARVHTAMLARRRTAAGVAGAQDGWAQASYQREQRAGRPGPHTRHMARGCAACAPRVYVAVPEACGACHGWRRRGPRGASDVCPECGGDRPAYDHGDAAAAGHLMHMSGAVSEEQPQHRRPAAEGDAARTPLRGAQPWRGFADLQETVVERLMRDGDHEAADARASALPPRAPSATVRHIHGMECDGVADAAGLRAEAAKAVNGMLRLVAAAGGRASALMAQLERAHTYLRRTVAASRAHGSDDEFRAFQAVVAGDLHNVDWSVSGGGDPREEARARSELADDMAKWAVHVGVVCKDARCGWQQAAAPQVAWRQESNAWRERLRTIMRAWREHCDVRHVRPAGRGILAMSMAAGPHPRQGCAATRLWRAGWQAKALLTWARLVRGGTGHTWQQRRQRRRHSPPDGHESMQPSARRHRPAQHVDDRGAAHAAGHAAADAGAQKRPRDEHVACGDAGHGSPQRRGRPPTLEPAAPECEACEECDAQGGGVQPGGGTSRSRRSDAVLALRSRARILLRAHLGGGETRLAHARRARGDG